MSGVRVLQRAARGVPTVEVRGADEQGRERVPGGAGAWPWAAVVATVMWSLWELRATVLPAQYLNDSSVQEQMVRFAAGQFGAGRVPVTALTAVGIAWLFPAWSDLDSYAALNSAAIHYQQQAQDQDQPQLAALATYLRHHLDGRAYAGSLSTAGQSFTIGYVPMSIYLQNLDADAAGYTPHTATLTTPLQYRFDPGFYQDYPQFGIRYLVLPVLDRSPAPLLTGAVMVLANSLFRVYKLDDSGYIRIAAPTLRRGSRPGGSAGTVLSSRADLADGTAATVVQLRRRAVVVLSASFDPDWTATIDGRPAPVQMVAPALPAVAVPPGTHRVTFRYTGFTGYPELLALAALSLLTTAAITRRRAQPRRPPENGGQPADSQPSVQRIAERNPDFTEVST